MATLVISKHFYGIKEDTHDRVWARLIQFVEQTMQVREPTIQIAKKSTV